MCFYYLPAFAAAFAELRSESRVLGDAMPCAGKLCIWTWELDPQKQGNWPERIMKYHVFKTHGENWGKTGKHIRIGKSSPSGMLTPCSHCENILFFIFFSSHLISFCSMDSNMVCAHRNTHQLINQMVLDLALSLYGKKGCSSRQENARDGSIDPHDPSPADRFSGREHTWKILPKKHPESSKPLQLCSPYAGIHGIIPNNSK